jgi:chromosome segregation ATPase
MHMTLSPEREKLATAIERQRDAQASLDEARRAQQTATQRWFAASARVTSIQQEIADFEQSPQSSSDRLIADLAGGLDVLVESPIADLRKQLDAAQAEVAVWDAARGTAEQAIESRRQALDLAEHYVDSAARRVVGAEVNVAALLSACAALRDEVLDAQSRIAAIAASVDHASDLRKRLDAFLSEGWLLDRPWRDRPAAQPIKSMFAALKADASVPLKAS